MTSWSLIIFALVVAAPVIAAEEETPVTRVVDSKVNRVPEHTVVPKYPRKSRRDRVEGEVEVCFEIDRQGRPRRIAVRNSTNRAFERASLKAVRESSFRPLPDDQELQSIKSCRTFIFSLQPVAGENQPQSLD